jgi:hypothetical protein
MPDCRGYVLNAVHIVMEKLDIQGVSEERVNILGGGNMDYYE